MESWITVVKELTIEQKRTEKTNIFASYFLLSNMVSLNILFKMKVIKDVQITYYKVKKFSRYVEIMQKRVILI